MGRIFQNSNATPSAGSGGRIMGTQDNFNVAPIKPTKDWASLNFAEKLFEVEKEIPAVIYNFLPKSIDMRPISEQTLPEFLAGGLKGALEFGKGIAQAVAQGIGGAALGVKEAITKQPERLEIPLLGTISSYQQQTKDLTAQGFSNDEAKALVGINAYLSVVPFAGKALQTKTGQAITQKLVTKEVPTAETPAGIKAEIRGKPVLPESMTRIERPAITTVKRAFGQTAEQQQFNEVLQGHLDKFFEGRGALLGKEDPLNKA